MNKMITDTMPAGIEYLGIPGVSFHCKRAIMRFLQYRDHITLARILSCGNSHCFLLTVNGDLTAIKSGFSSGYDGEGPRAFSYVIELLHAHGIEIEEYEVTKDFFERVDMSSLTNGDIEELDKSHPVEPPRWYEYMIDSYWEREKNKKIWRDFPYIIPLSIIDSRIIDLALQFWENPDQSLTIGYRRLEDIVRRRTGSKEHGVGLFSEVFLGQKAKLGWKGVDVSEQKGRGMLFTAIYMAYRNPRAHRELDKHYHMHIAEFLLLNQLFVLEKESYDFDENNSVNVGH